MRLLIGLLIVFCLGIYAAEKHPAAVRKAKAAVRSIVISILE